MLEIWLGLGVALVGSLVVLWWCFRDKGDKILLFVQIEHTEVHELEDGTYCLEIESQTTQGRRYRFSGRRPSIHSARKLRKGSCVVVDVAIAENEAWEQDNSRTTSVIRWSKSRPL